MQFWNLKPSIFPYRSVPTVEDALTSKESADDIHSPLLYLRHTHRILIACSLVLAMIEGILLVFIVRWTGTQHVDILKEIHGVVPKLAYEYIEFKPDPNFAFPPSTETNKAWNSLSPPGGGYVAIDSPAKYGLKPGVPISKDREGFSLSIFHQLHCLAMLRTNYYFTHSPNYNSSNEPSDIHIQHCFDLVRQGIMCAGDTTLEQSTPDGHGPGHPGVDGWYNVHRCTSWSAIWEYMLEHTVGQDVVDFVPII